MVWLCSFESLDIDVQLMQAIFLFFVFCWLCLQALRCGQRGVYLLGNEVDDNDDDELSHNNIEPSFYVGKFFLRSIDNNDRAFIFMLCCNCCRETG